MTVKLSKLASEVAVLMTESEQGQQDQQKLLV